MTAGSTLHRPPFHLDHVLCFKKLTLAGPNGHRSFARAGLKSHECLRYSVVKASQVSREIPGYKMRSLVIFGRHSLHTPC